MGGGREGEREEGRERERERERESNVKSINLVPPTLASHSHERGKCK